MPSVCPVLFLILLQHHLQDRANKMRVFVSKKITDFVYPVLPHLWRTKRGVQGHPMVVIPSHTRPLAHRHLLSRAEPVNRVLPHVPLGGEAAKGLPLGSQP